MIRDRYKNGPADGCKDGEYWAPVKNSHDNFDYI